MTGEKVNYNELISSSGISEKKTAQRIPHMDVNFLNVIFVPFLASTNLVF